MNYGFCYYSCPTIISFCLIVGAIIIDIERTCTFEEDDAMQWKDDETEQKDIKTHVVCSSEWVTHPLLLLCLSLGCLSAHVQLKVKLNLICGCLHGGVPKVNRNAIPSNPISTCRQQY